MPTNSRPIQKLLVGTNFTEKNKHIVIEPKRIFVRIPQHLGGNLYTRRNKTFVTKTHLFHVIFHKPEKHFNLQNCTEVYHNISVYFCSEQLTAGKYLCIPKYSSCFYLITSQDLFVESQNISSEIHERIENRNFFT